MVFFFLDAAMALVMFLRAAARCFSVAMWPPETMFLSECRSDEVARKLEPKALHRPIDQELGGSRRLAEDRADVFHGQVVGELQDHGGALLPRQAIDGLPDGSHAVAGNDFIGRGHLDGGPGDSG